MIMIAVLGESENQRRGKRMEICTGVTLETNGSLVQVIHKRISKAKAYEEPRRIY